MKSKRFLCTVLACVVMISCITNAAAIQEEVADDFVEYNTESILTTRAIGEFEMTVSAKTKAIVLPAKKYYLPPKAIITLLLPHGKMVTG